MKASAIAPLLATLAVGLLPANALRAANEAPATPPAGAPVAAAPAGTPSSPAEKPSKFRSPEDGAFDVSAFLDEAYGFIPVVVPITEPAVGYGAGGALAFIDKPMGQATAGFGRPNISVIGGMKTENGTWGVFGADVRHWAKDSVQTLAGGIYASVNLDYFGMGEDSPLVDHPLRYTLEPLGGLVQAKARLGKSRWWAGGAFAYAKTDVSFEAPPGTPGLPSFDRESHVGGLVPMVSYDSRDNVFTPGSGTYAEFTAGLFGEKLGSDTEFQRITLLVMHYVPLATQWTLGLRGSATGSYGDAPFYLRPFIMMRGVAAMQFQGETVAQAEAEVRWQFWKRYSAVGFAGTGKAWSDTDRGERSRTATAGGVGFRYEIARKYGLHMGLDLAWGPDDPVIYVQFGSAWMRP